jgi:hypothetical protein
MLQWHPRFRHQRCDILNPDQRPHSVIPWRKLRPIRMALTQAISSTMTGSPPRTYIIILSLYSLPNFHQLQP